MLKLKLAAIAGLFLLVAACATDPKVRWAQTQGVVNEFSELARSYREPCLTGEAEHGCYLTQEEFVKIDSYFDEAEGALDKYKKTGEIDYLDIAERASRKAIDELRELGL